MLKFPYPSNINGRRVTTEICKSAKDTIYRAIYWDFDGSVYFIQECTDLWALRECAMFEDPKYNPKSWSY